MILPELILRDIIGAARRQSAEFGLLVEVAAVTGARVSQLARIEVQNLPADREAPRLMLPTSKKGKGQKSVQRRQVPIPIGLAAKLRVLSAGRPATEPLLVKPSGEPWKKSDHSRLFARAAKAASEDPERVTMYALLQPACRRRNPKRESRQRAHHHNAAGRLFGSPRQKRHRLMPQRNEIRRPARGDVP